MAFLAANLLGLFGFLWPLLLRVAPAVGEGRAHAADAPVLLALATPLLLLVALRSAGGKRSDARLVALLGALVAVNAFLRIPKGPSGEGFVFILPILCGWWVGARFGFLLGAFSILASAVLTGGVGPWMPFQMFALGWVGGGAGLLRRVVRGRAPRMFLATYAVVSSIGYGFVMTLWFWPFLATGGAGPLYSPKLAPLAALARYARFYELTSLGWDTGRALLANLPLVVALARPLGTLLGRVRGRLEVVVEAQCPITPRARSARPGEVRPETGLAGPPVRRRAAP